MDLTMNMKIVVPEDILVQDVHGESVLLNLDNRYYYGLDKMGTQMWRTLSGSESIQKWVDELNRHNLETHLWCVVHGNDVDAEAERIVEACPVLGGRRPAPRSFQAGSKAAGLRFAESRR